MKKSSLATAVFLFFFTLSKAQEIELHSITADRESYGDTGYTLDGIHMNNTSTLKLLNPDHFGDGIYPKFINLTHAYGTSGSLEEITSIDDIDLFIMGTFNTLNPDTEEFTKNEIDSLYVWSKRGGKLILGASASLPGLGFDPDIMNNRWGFSIEAIEVQAPPSQLIIPSEDGVNTEIFTGPFGSVTAAEQGGFAQGYFNSLPESVVVLGENEEGDPTLILDCATLDLIICDFDAYTDLGGVSPGFESQNQNDIFWLNSIVYMDQMQDPPAIVQNGLELSAGTHEAYQWLLNGQPINGSTDGTFTISEEGDYSVTVDMSNGCTVTSDVFSAAFTSTEENALLQGLQIFPNPVAEHLAIELTLLESTSVKLDIFDSTGKRMPSFGKDLKLSQGPQHISLDVAGLTAGFYELILSTNTGNKAIKFIK